MENNLLNKYLGNKKSENNKAHHFVSKILICIIILLVSLIATSFSPKVRDFYNKYLFGDNFKFMEFKNFYEKFAGGIAKKEKENNKASQMVMAGSLEFASSEKYLDGTKYLNPSGNAVSALESGIVVYAAEKDGYGKTIIIQGSDGFDIWYAGVEDTNVSMYDYVKKGSSIASIGKELILLINKDGKYYTYEEYQKEIQS